MEKGHYDTQTSKLNKDLNKYLGKLEKSLEARWGSDKASSIIKRAKAHYPEIIIRDQALEYLSVEHNTKTQ